VNYIEAIQNTLHVSRLQTEGETRRARIKGDFGEEDARLTKMGVDADALKNLYPTLNPVPTMLDSSTMLAPGGLMRPQQPVPCPKF
jgi:hypothetical protein